MINEGKSNSNLVRQRESGADKTVTTKMLCNTLPFQVVGLVQKEGQLSIKFSRFS